MKEVLIHYGVKGMKWGVRKQYEAAGGGGGGGWGPNNPVGGNPLAAAAASVPNSPKGKKNVGENAVENMGVKDKKLTFKEQMAARKKEQEKKRQEAERRKKEEAFEKDFNKNWVKSYNRAADRHNKVIEKINSELPDDWDIYTDAGREYVKQIGDSWKSIYTEELMKDFGDKSKEIGLAENWVNAAPFMRDYDMALLELDEAMGRSR